MGLRIIGIICVCLLISGSIFYLNLAPRVLRTGYQKLGDGCRDVYLDLGTNIGVQIRKLYEPSYFPKSRSLQIFTQYFGLNRSSVCTFGWEPNPTHTQYLQALQESYNRQGWRVQIDNAAVSDSDGFEDLFVDVTGAKNQQWGSRLGSPKTPNDTVVRIRTVDFARWFKREICDRRMPAASGNYSSAPTILAKVDLEGWDERVLSSLISSGLICNISFIYAEHISKDFLDGFLAYTKNNSQCKTILVQLDDESYHNLKPPFP